MNYTKEGEQLGSNPGGLYRDSEDGKFYIKFPYASGQAKAEEVADTLYALVGVRTLGHKQQTIFNKEASLCQWVDGLRPVFTTDWGTAPVKHQRQMARIILASVWLKNWDCFGLEYDNVLRDMFKDELVLVDTGGAFHYRAQGENKGFDGSAELELDHMFDPQGHVGIVANQLLTSKPRVFEEAAWALAGVSALQLQQAANDLGDPGYSDYLSERRAKIFDKFSQIF